MTTENSTTDEPPIGTPPDEPPPDEPTIASATPDPDDAPVETPAAETPAEPAAPTNLHWYVVKVQSGREESIKEAIEKKVKIEGLQSCFGQIVIPTEKVSE